MVFCVKIKAYTDPDPLLWPSHFLSTSGEECRKKEYFSLVLSVPFFCP